MSYVVNNGPRPVAAATRERVLASVRALNYRPNTAARTLKVGSSRSIGLIVSDSANIFASEVAVAIQREADRLGYAVFVVYFEGIESRAEKAIVDLVSRQVDGIVLVSNLKLPDTRAAVDTDTPIFVVGDRPEGPGAFGVGVDSFGGAKLAVEHLVWHGHRNIGLIVGPEMATEVHREAGWRAGLAEAHLESGPISRGSWSAEGGYLAGLELVSSPDRPTAVFVTTDRQSTGALRAFHESGMSVPGDIALVSFDGIEDSAYASPPLTTLRQPVSTLAEAAMAYLVRGEKLVAENGVLPTELVIRASCGCTYPVPAKAISSSD